MIRALPENLKQTMIATGTWNQSSPVPLARLSLIAVPYIDFDGKTHEGQVVALDTVASEILGAFKDLFARRFPINKVKAIHEYHGDDEASMADNNSSCYCCRPILNSSVLSVHAYGAAVDINPLQNPYIVFDEAAGTASFHPRASWQYANRSHIEKGMVEPIVDVFASHGFFVWGGRWKTPIDYHHFQIPRGLAELLVALEPDHARHVFESMLANQKRCALIPSGDQLTPLIDVCRRSTNEFIAALDKLAP